MPTAQLAFDFFQETHALDSLTSWLGLSLPYTHKQKAHAWMIRRWHSSAEEALKEARLLSPILGRIYIVEHPVDKNFQHYWPYPTIWRNCLEAPFSGTSGAFYYGKPNLWIIQSGTEFFEPGETSQQIAIKQADVTNKWDLNHPEG